MELPFGSIVVPFGELPFRILNVNHIYSVATILVLGPFGVHASTVKEQERRIYTEAETPAHGYTYRNPHKNP